MLKTRPWSDPVVQSDKIWHQAHTHTSDHLMVAIHEAYTLCVVWRMLGLDFDD